MKGRKPSVIFVDGKFKPNELALVRFWAKVKKGVGCWEWTGKIKPGICGGYGMFGTKTKQYRAHIISWLINGNETQGLCVLHKCDNRKCVRVDHLFLGTRTENMWDKVRKGRQSHANCKLTDSQVREIRSKYIPYKYSAIRLGREFKISPSQAYEVATNRSYKHIT